MILATASDSFRSTWGMPASIPLPSIERSLERSIRNGIKSYGGGKALDYLVSTEGDSQ